MREVRTLLPAPGLPRPSPPVGATRPVRQLLAYGMGGAGLALTGAGLQTLAGPVFNVGYGLNPAWVSLVLALPRLWELVVNPWVGAVTDQAVAEGRSRRPYLWRGAVTTGLAFAVIWWVPRDVAAAWQYAWLAVAALGFHTAASAYAVPYMALGYDLSPDYHERTRIAGFRAACSFVTRPLLAWMLPLCHLTFFADVGEGARWVGLATGVVILGCCLVPVSVRLEPPRTGSSGALSGKPEARQDWWREFGRCCRNRPFALLMGAVVLKGAAGAFTSTLGLYVLTYYCFRGEWQQGAALGAMIATAYHLVSALAVPAMVALARRVGKRGALLAGLGCGVLGTLLKWPLYGPNPDLWLILVPLCMAPAVAGADLVLGSMLADVCDHDELASGRRRSGVFAGAAMWMGKAGVSVGLIASGLILNASGFSAALVQQDGTTLVWLRLAISILPALLFIGAVGCVLMYPLDGRRVAEIQAALGGVRERSRVI